MSDLIFTTRGVAEVLAAQEKLAEQMGKQKSAAAQLNQEYKANQAELNKLGRIAQAVYRETENDLERYNRKLAEAKAALQGNADATQRLQRFETQLKIEYAKSVDANKNLLQQRADAAKAAIAEQKKLATAIEDTGTSAQDAGNIFAEVFSPTKLAGFASTVLSVQTAINLIGGELRAQQEMVDKRMATQATVAEGRNVLLRNLVGSSDQEIKQAMDASRSIADSTGMSEAATSQALAAAISASGNIPVAIKLTERSAQFLKDRPSEVGDFAGALGDLTRVTGTNDPDVALGLLATIGKISRPVSIQQTSQSLAPALLNTLPFGGDARSAGALYAALTTGTGDTSGLHTKTGVVALAEQLLQAARGEGTFAGTSTRPGFTPGELQGRNLDERIQFLQRNPALAKKFLDIASFERTNVGAITELLTDPRSRMAQDYQLGLNMIGDNRQLRAMGLGTQGMFARYNVLEPRQEFSRSLSSTLEQQQVNADPRFLKQEEIEKLKDVLRETGDPAIVGDLNVLLARANDFGKVSTREAVDVLKRREFAILHPSPLPSNPETGQAASYTPTVTEADRKSAAALQKQIEKLEELLRATKETNDILRNAPGGVWGGSG